MSPTRGYRSEFHLKKQSQIWIQCTYAWGTFQTTSMETAQLVGKKDQIFFMEIGSGEEI
jgi:hypothetical protein